MYKSNICAYENRRTGRECGAPVEDDAPFNICLYHVGKIGEWWKREMLYIIGSAMQNESNQRGLLSRANVGKDHTIREPHVYYILHGNRIKIGWSDYWQKRVKQLPFDRVLAVEPGSKNLEAERHAMFEPHRIRDTEWFEAVPELWDFITEVSEANPDDAEAVHYFNRNLVKNRQDRRARSNPYFLFRK